MKDLLLLCHLIDSKNEINRRRRKYYNRANERYLYITINAFMKNPSKYPGARPSNYDDNLLLTRTAIPENIRELNVIKYNSMKKLGKTRMPHIKRLAKKLKVKMKWDESGNIKYFMNETRTEKWEMSRIKDLAIDYHLLIGA